MKLIHLSDLHIGKRLNDFSLLEDQEYILKQILSIIDTNKPDAVILAGDIYDKTVPSAEAVSLFDDFLVALAKRNLQVYIISGNHDSPERMAFGGRIMDTSGIHISPVYDKKISRYTLEDEYGSVNISLLPFIKPAHVRRYFPDENIESYTDAVKTALSCLETDKNERNILITHQFVTGASVGGSEELSVGGSENVDADVFAEFDYVALGHIHGPQRVGRDTVRYCGTPLKYSFSEAGHQKSVTIAELKEKGNVSIKTVELVPLRDMREIKGSYLEITNKQNYEKTNCRDYMHITLTDEEDIPDAMGKLRVIYPNLMKLDYDNTRTRSSQSAGLAEDVESKSHLELFSEFYQKQNNKEMSHEQLSFVAELIEKIWEDEL